MTQYLIRFANGAVGTIGSSRVGTGRKLGLDYKIQGTKGAPLRPGAYERAPALPATPTRPPSAATRPCTSAPTPGLRRLPIAAIGLGYNDQKIINARELIWAIAEGRPAGPDFAFGHAITQVIDAVDESAKERRWVRLDEI